MNNNYTSSVSENHATNHIQEPYELLRQAPGELTLNQKGAAAGIRAALVFRDERFRAGRLLPP